jgi:hypothetical protein
MRREGRMTRFTFEDAELASRRTFFELTDDDLARLASPASSPSPSRYAIYVRAARVFRDC